MRDYENSRSGEEEDPDEFERGIVPWIDTRIDLGSQAEPIPDDLRENPISRSVGELQDRAFGPVIASCGRRFVAKAIDGLLGVLGCIGGAIWWTRRFEGEQQILWMLFLATFGLAGGWLLWVIYHALLRGDTIGKRIMGLQVVDERARPIGVGRSVGRVLAETISLATAGIGHLFAVVDPHKRSLHDHLCGTRVVRRDSLPGRL